MPNYDASLEGLLAQNKYKQKRQAAALAVVSLGSLPSLAVEIWHRQGHKLMMLWYHRSISSTPTDLDNLY